MTPEQFQKATEISNTIQQLSFLKYYLEAITKNQMIKVSMRADVLGSNMVSPFSIQVPEVSNVDLIQHEIAHLLEHIDTRIVLLNESMKAI